MTTRWQKGFTLLELLVVIAIIALIASLILATLGSWRARSRDVTREAEIKELQKALALYIASHGTFPVGSSVVLTGTDAVYSLLTADGLIRLGAIDPLQSGVYVFTYNSAAGQTYTITYTLETNTITGKSAGAQTAAP